MKEGDGADLGIRTGSRARKSEQGPDSPQGISYHRADPILHWLLHGYTVDEPKSNGLFFHLLMNGAEQPTFSWIAWYVSASPSRRSTLATRASSARPRRAGQCWLLPD